MLRVSLGLLLCWVSAASVDAGPQRDGPYLFHRVDGSVEAIWVEDGARKLRTFKKGDPVVLTEFAHLLGESLALIEHQPAPAIIPAPERMLVVSDVEGEYDGLVEFLQKNGVIDSQKGWSYGEGHLITVGDMVDRGDQVTEVLWLMYRLSREARAAGGRVHFVLGNHETMILGGDIRYIAQKYQRSVEILKVPYPALYGGDTEVGRWLRAQNSVVIIGDYLFVHAGIAPSLNLKRQSVERLNELVRRHLGTPSKVLAEKDLAAAKLIWGSRGPFWYRGYFAQHAAQSPTLFGPVTTQEQITQIMKDLGAKTMVIGHTKVESPRMLFGGREVLALDVPWTKPKEVRGLLVRGDETHLVDIGGKKEVFEMDRTKTPEPADEPHPTSRWPAAIGARCP